MNEKYFLHVPTLLNSCFYSTADAEEYSSDCDNFSPSTQSAHVQKHIAIYANYIMWERSMCDRIQLKCTCSLSALTLYRATWRISSHSHFTSAIVCFLVCLALSGCWKIFSACIPFVFIRNIYPMLSIGPGRPVHTQTHTTIVQYNNNNKWVYRRIHAYTHTPRRTIDDGNTQSQHKYSINCSIICKWCGGCADLSD